MEISTAIDGTNASIALDGNLTVASTPELEAAIAGLPENVTSVDLDLSKLSYVASAGLRVFVALDKRMHAAGGSMHLLHPCDEVMEVFDVTGLVGILDVRQ